MSGKIYLLQEDDTLQSLSEQPYSSEDLLQTLLEKYPDLLAGDQIDESEPRRWLLVSREVGVPSEEGGYDQWSLDHLFLDQDGIPTLVEVKRSSDTRIRREVVGQMLDYAANAVVYWPLETIRTKFEAECELRGEDPTQLIHDLIDKNFEEGMSEQQFWSSVKTNLQAQRIRMVFVADEIPPELRRIVEFLNEQMDPAEVLAVEIRQFVGQDLRTLVPRVIGQTADAQQKKSYGGGRSYKSEQELLDSWVDEVTNAYLIFRDRILEQGDVVIEPRKSSLSFYKQLSTDRVFLCYFYASPGKNPHISLRRDSLQQWLDVEHVADKIEQTMGSDVRVSRGSVYHSFYFQPLREIAHKLADLLIEHAISRVE